MELWQWHCQNRREKNGSNWFVALPLPKLKGKKKCGNEFVAMALHK